MAATTGRRRARRVLRRILVAGTAAVAAAAVVVNVGPLAFAALRGRSTLPPTVTVAPPQGAASPRAQTAANPGVVGLGDSVPAGTACTCTNYVTLVAQQLAARGDAPVPVTNLAADGETTSGLLGQLTQPATQRALAGARVAIVTIGANDFDPSDVAYDECRDPYATACYGTDLGNLRARLAMILTSVRSAMPADGQVLVTGYWNVFLDGQVGAAKGASYAANSNALTVQVNSVVSAAAAATGATYVDVYTPFKGSGSGDDTALLAADGDHPNAAGHQVIAAALLQALS